MFADDIRKKLQSFFSGRKMLESEPGYPGEYIGRSEVDVNVVYVYENTIYYAAVGCSNNGNITKVKKTVASEQYPRGFAPEIVNGRI